jgi:indolepyruvate ferredoxin oxidoreductase alpha subunit
VPVILRLTTRICHVKGLVTVGEREAHEPAGFVKNAAALGDGARPRQARIPLMLQRERTLREVAETTPLNVLEPGSDRRVGFVTSGPAYMHVREAFPDAPVLKLGLSYPWPLEEAARRSPPWRHPWWWSRKPKRSSRPNSRPPASPCHGKDILPRMGELSPQVLTPAVERLLGKESVPRRRPAAAPPKLFPRPPTCAPPARTWASTTRCRRSRT